MLLELLEEERDVRRDEIARRRAYGDRLAYCGDWLHVDVAFLSWIVVVWSFWVKVFRPRWVLVLVFGLIGVCRRLAREREHGQRHRDRDSHEDERRGLHVGSP
jgi:hypothetical protein